MPSKVTLTFRDKAAYDGLLKAIVKCKGTTKSKLEELLAHHKGLTIKENKPQVPPTTLSDSVINQMNKVYLRGETLEINRYNGSLPGILWVAAREYFLRLLDNDYQITFHDYPPATDRSVQLAVYRALCAYVPFNKDGWNFLETKEDKEVAGKLIDKIGKSRYTNARMAYHTFTVIVWHHLQQMPQFNYFKDKMIRDGKERDADVLHYVNGELRKQVLKKAYELHHL